MAGPEKESYWGYIKRTGFTVVWLVILIVIANLAVINFGAEGGVLFALALVLYIFAAWKWKWWTPFS